MNRTKADLTRRLQARELAQRHEGEELHRALERALAAPKEQGEEK